MTLSCTRFSTAHARTHLDLGCSIGLHEPRIRDKAMDFSAPPERSVCACKLLKVGGLLSNLSDAKESSSSYFCGIL